MLVQKQNLEMICDPSDYFIHVSEAGEDRKQLSMADTWGEKIPAMVMENENPLQNYW